MSGMFIYLKPFVLIVNLLCFVSSSLAFLAIITNTGIGMDFQS